jgi:hypothetical protein
MGNTEMIMEKRIVVWLFTAIVTAAALPAVTFADTDGSEIQITDRPDKLVLQLGSRWAGVEFELKTDAGVFPVPIPVNASGVLETDLGGSKTYILSCLESSVPIPNPEQQTDTPATAPPPGNPGSAPNPKSGRTAGGIPTGVLLAFAVGLAAAGGFFAASFLGRRREAYDYDCEDEDDADYDDRRSRTDI